MRLFYEPSYFEPIGFSGKSAGIIMARKVVLFLQLSLNKSERNKTLTERNKTKWTKEQFSWRFSVHYSKTSILDYSCSLAGLSQLDDEGHA